jgi:membrane protease YdiL (CAAX protease family)
MDMLSIKETVLYVLPLGLPITAIFIFSKLANKPNKAKSYIIGFLLYWTICCLIIPLTLLGVDEFLLLFVGENPLFARNYWWVGLLWLFITLVTIGAYGKDFLHASPKLILIAVPIAAINGLCEELLWRGMYVRAFPDKLLLAVLLPSIGFAFWHLAPLQIFSEGNKALFIISTFFLGLAYGLIAFKTGSAKWTAISHSINGILALGGAVAPCVLTLLTRSNPFSREQQT